MAPPSHIGTQGVINLSILDPIKRIQDYIDGYRLDPEYKGFDHLLMHHIHVLSSHTSPSPDQSGFLSHSTFSIPVTPEMCNSMGNMHGGCVATLADNCTTAAAAPVAREGFWDFGGVSRTLSVTYLRPIRVGRTVVVECWVRSAGRKLSTIQCIMRDKESGKVLALGEHGKAAMSKEDRAKASTKL